MKPEYRSFVARLRPLLEPAIGLAFFTFWMVVFRGELSLDLVGMRRIVASWIVVLGLIAIAIALSRIAPRISVGLSLAVVVVQFAWPLSRFWVGGWPLYSGFLVFVFGLAVSAPPALRKTAAVLVGVLAVLVSALTTIPALGPYDVALLFGRSAALGAGTTLRNFVAVLAFALALGYGSWLLGCVVRYRRVAHERGPYASGLDVLSTRERDVFALAARGLTNPEIAAHLYVSEATVKSHMTSILAKLQLPSRSRLIAFAYENALVTSPA